MNHNSWMMQIVHTLLNLLEITLITTQFIFRFLFFLRFEAIKIIFPFKKKDIPHEYGRSWKAIRLSF